MENYFAILNSINVNDKVEKKNGLSYLSWAYAWAEVKKLFPDANYTIYENKDGWNYHTDGRTCWVKTGVSIQGIEHVEELPVMDYRNASIPLDKVTSFDVNKAIQRSLTKAVARHGLGLYIYAGEDLPEENSGTEPVAEVRTRKPRQTKKAEPEYMPVSNEDYMNIVKAYVLGRIPKAGGNYRDAWITMTHAKPEHIEKFDMDAADLRAAINQ